MQVEKRELAHIKFPAKIRPGGREEFVNETIAIPPLPPTNVRNSNLIRLNYDVYVSNSQFIEYFIFSKPRLSQITLYV